MSFSNFKVYLSQVKSLTEANLKSRYRGTWTGFFWVILNPIIMYGAQSYAFNYVLQIKITYYGLFLLSGLLPWLFLTQSIDMGITTLINHRRLLKSFPIHPLVLISALVLENFLNFLAAFFLMLIPACFIYHVPFVYLLATPLAFFFLLAGVMAMTSLTAILNVFYRDMKFVFNFLLGISFFITPIFYDTPLIPNEVKWITHFNVFFYLISPFRELLHSQDLPAFGISLIKAAFVVSFLVLLTWVYWTKKRNSLYAKL